MNSKAYWKSLYAVTTFLVLSCLLVYIFMVRSQKQVEHSISRISDLFDNNKSQLPSCPDELENPVGTIQLHSKIFTFTELEQMYTEENRTDLIFLTPLNVSAKHHLSKESRYKAIKVNGQPTATWTPVDCQPKQSVAIIIPYRNRMEHLLSLLHHLHSFLRHQKLQYNIIVVEQLGKTKFNRGLLFNAGFLKSIQIANFDCYVFHDVDKFPLNDAIDYNCANQPRHLSSHLSTFKYQLFYETFIGGVLSIQKQQYILVNGFSNCYFGWGGEDDDFYLRLKWKKLEVLRFPNDTGRYYEPSHQLDEQNQRNERRYDLLKFAGMRFNKDGLTNTYFETRSAEPKYGGLVYWISVEISDNENLPECSGNSS